MKDREILIAFIKEVIAGHDGIYNWSWSSYYEVYGFPSLAAMDRRDKDIENDPDLWRKKILRRDWMVNNPAWNVYEIGMDSLDDDGAGTNRANVTILVDKNKSVNEFVSEYKDQWDTPIYIDWVEILGADGGFYKDIDEVTQ